MGLDFFIEGNSKNFHILTENVGVMQENLSHKYKICPTWGISESSHVWWSDTTN